MSILGTAAYCFNKEPRVRHILYGYVISSLHLLVIGIPLYLGYFVRIVSGRSDSKYQESPPQYRPLYPMAIDGVYAFLLAAGTFGIPFIGSAVISGFLTNSTLSSSSTQFRIAIFALAVLLIIGLVGTYVYPAVISVYSVSHNWRDPYDLGTIRNIAFRRDYLILYLKFTVVNILLGLLTSLAIESIILLPIAALFMFIYANVVGVLIGDFALKNKQLLPQNSDRSNTN